MTQLLGEIDDESAEEKLETCNHFLAESEMDDQRNKVFNFAMEVLDAHTLSPSIDTVFKKLKCAAELNFAFGFVLKVVEDGSCQYYYAHENDVFMKRRSKFVMTKEDLVKIESMLSNTDVIELITKERANKKW